MCFLLILISATPLRGPSGWAGVGPKKLWQLRCDKPGPLVFRDVLRYFLGAKRTHGARVSFSTHQVYSQRHSALGDSEEVCVWGAGGELALSYRLPRAAVPRGGAWAGLQVALLHVGRLVQHIAVVVVEPLAVGPLADNQAGPPSSPTGLGALAKANTQC